MYLARRHGFGRVAGRSAAALVVLALVASLGPSLASGQTQGTGDEAARALESATAAAARRASARAPADAIGEVEAPEAFDRIEVTASRLERKLRALLAWLPLAGVALAVIVLGLIAGRLVAAWTWPYRLIVRSPLIRGVTAQAAGTAVFLAAVLVALDLLDATALVGAVLGAAGVLGLALGFAFRDIIENYLASLLLAVRRPFRAQDLVRVGEHEGKVMRLTMRETILMTLDGNHLRLPNATVFKSVIINYTLNPLRQLSFLVGVSTEHALLESHSVGKRALIETPGVVAEPPPFVRTEALGESSVTVKFHAWVDQREADWYKVRSEAIRRVKEALDDARIEMPEPIYRVVLQQPAAAPVAADPAHPPARVPMPLAEAEVPDVRPDDYLERQIDDDLRRRDDGNLLSEPPVES